MSSIPYGFIVNSISLQPGETRSLEYTFSSMGITSSGKSKGSGFETDMFKVYPNPNSIGIVNITNSEKINELIIYSMTGKIVWKFKNQKQSFNVSGLKTGIYIIKIKADNKLYTRKISVLE